MKIWTWLDGKKTIIGAVITAISYLAAGLPTLLPGFGLEPSVVGKIVGVSLLVVGLLHKGFKLKYGSDLP
jgi:hypothetical protein